MFDQAARIIKSFNGASKLARHLNLPAPTVYRWGYPRNRGGTGGLIPAYRIEQIMIIAKKLNIKLDWSLK